MMTNEIQISNTNKDNTHNNDDYNINNINIHYNDEIDNQSKDVEEITTMSSKRKASNMNYLNKHIKKIKIFSLEEINEKKSISKQKIKYDIRSKGCVKAKT